MSRGSFIAIFLMLVAAGGLFVAVTNGDEGNGLAVTESGSAESSSAEPAVVDVEEDPAETPTTEAPEPDDTDNLGGAPPILGSAGTLEDVDIWLQTEATSFEDFDGRVLIVQFWTHSCRNCTATIPFLQDIYATYEPQGLEIIGVHAPEFDFEKDIPGVAQRAEELGVTWPIAIDNQKTNFRTWQPDRRFWPRTFVIDQNGDIRFNRIGEGKYQELEDTVAWLIENGP